MNGYLKSYNFYMNRYKRQITGEAPENIIVQQKIPAYSKLLTIFSPTESRGKNESD